MKYLPDYQCVLLHTLCGWFFSCSSADKGENVLFRLLFASLQRYLLCGQGFRNVTEMYLQCFMAAGINQHF